MTRNDTPFSAKKSAVIISQDGEIEQHIPADEKDIVEVELDAARNNDALPVVNQVVYVNTAAAEVNEPPEKPTISNRTKNLIYVAVSILIIIGAFSLIFSTPDHHPAINSPPQQAVSTPIEDNQSELTGEIREVILPQSLSDLKRVANVILEDEQQDTTKIDLFVDGWNLMDQFSQQDFNNSFWMQRFRALLETKINELDTTATDKFSATHTTTYKHTLLNMAALINTLQEEIQSPTSGTELEFDELFKSLSSELALAEKEKILSDENSAIDEFSDTDAIDSSTEMKPASTSTQGFTESDINYLLGQYATTYEFGSTNKIMKLFSAQSAYKKALKKNFEKVFNYSSERKIIFSEFNWQFFSNTVVGHGKYKAIIKLKQNKGTRNISAHIRIKIKVIQNRLSIARMNFSNVRVKLDKPKHVEHKPVVFNTRKVSLQTNNSIEKNSISKIRTNVNRPLRRRVPTAAELQDIVSRFISAYESGDITELENIFSENAKTNDQIGLTEIKNDYKILFSHTTDRQLFIQDMKWSIVDNYARGKGILNLLIVAEGTNKIRSQQGIIQITAQKKNNRIFITHLFHDLRN
ncbi:MAG: hypothetical protein ACC707_04980 [Thiohalomonadales bacterium]